MQSCVAAQTCIEPEICGLIQLVKLVTATWQCTDLLALYTQGHRNALGTLQLEHLRYI